MLRLAPRYTRTGSLFPYATLFRSFELLHPEARHHAVLAGGGPGALWVALRLYPVQRAGCRAQSARRRIGFNPACIQKSLCAARNSSTATRSEEHTSELQSLMRISYAVFCLKKKKRINTKHKQRT